MNDDDVTRVENLLRASRPAPARTWRGSVRQSLVAERALPSRPPRLIALAAAFGASGALLLVVAALLV